MLNDHQQRLEATDPSRSFIVQAPAGSGKTEILTQRFLRLLSQVNAPEQIIALTFTRKAANEMRERIILALQRAAEDLAPQSDHQRLTQTYAKQALARDHSMNWQLLKQPNRLRIMTIDALCQMLTHAIPLQAIHYANIHELPHTLYLNAARACLRFASSTNVHQPDLKMLLQHMDNRQDLLISLFAQLLSQRDQWLTPIYLARHQSRQQFEQALAWIESHELARFKQSVPLELQPELVALLRTFVHHVDLPTINSARLNEWQHFEETDAELAAILGSLLLTSSQTLRKAFDHHIGLKRDNCPPDVYTYLKTQSKQLFAQLTECPDFLNGLISVCALPKPQFSDKQWQILQALLNTLPLLVAHLELQFQDTNSIDFAGIAHQARLSLGDEQAPTDLALYLDHHIQHLLIDEFQDTSLQQFELLTQLVQGWETHDGRTLFVVGDPMQSIYRFRAAEVGLFLRAQHQGIGNVPLHALHLSSNFRSAINLVTWVNQQFQAIFPRQDDIESGAISFHASAPVRTSDEHSFIQAYAHNTPLGEAEGIADAIQQELDAYTDTNIAILVRSRRQLHTIIQVLHERNIPFQGVDIDLLAHLPHLRDVWSLTQALMMPANRLAWLALLRSPWCGLELADLLIIAQHSKSIYVALSQVHVIPELSQEGLIRAQYIYAVLHSALSKRQQQPLVDWLLTVLKSLHLDKILTLEQQDDLEQYWLLIKQFEQDGQLTDFKQFQTQFNALYSKKITPSRLQIMTIHKSKGLEFDCVILPGLSSKSAQRDQALIRWLRLPTHHHNDIFLISPIKAAEDDVCLLYNYLGRLDAQKARYESQRLLYVALTRAKQRLYLFDHHTIGRQGTFREMLSQHIFTPIATDAPLTDAIDYPSLWRLPIAYYQQIPIEPAPSNISPLTIATSEPRLVGIVAHELLQWICTYHPADQAHVPWQLAHDHLKTLGFIDDALQSAIDHIQDHIQAFMADPIGKWICKHHQQEQNEYSLLTQDATKIIDRTFVENEIRWIIDFKTGKYDELTHTTYQAQLQQYAELMQQKPGQIIRCGLYYLANHQWTEWEPVLCLT